MEQEREKLKQQKSKDSSGLTTNPAKKRLNVIKPFKKYRKAVQWCASLSRSLYCQQQQQEEEEQQQQKQNKDILSFDHLLDYYIVSFLVF